VVGLGVFVRGLQGGMGWDGFVFIRGIGMRLCFALPTCFDGRTKLVARGQRVHMIVASPLLTHHNRILCFTNLAAFNPSDYACDPCAKPRRRVTSFISPFAPLRSLISAR
jgi:hypothetical protein